MDLQHTLTLWAHNGVSGHTSIAGVLDRFLEDILVITRDQELGLLHVDTEPFTFHASLPCLELGDTLLVMSTRSSAQRSSHVTPVWNSSEGASSTRMKSGGLGTEPWCIATPTPNSTLYWPLTCTRLQALEYMPWMTCTAHYSTPRLLDSLGPPVAIWPSLVLPYGNPRLQHVSSERRHMATKILELHMVT